MKSHLFFRNPQEGLSQYRQRPGGGGSSKDDLPRDYSRMARTFAESITVFHREQELRHRIRTIEVPSHFDLIEIEFQGAFDQPSFEGSYFNEFGLVLAHLSTFNRRGLFAIENEENFRNFFNQVSHFISHELEGTDDDYDPKIRFIRNFKLFSSADMRGNIDNYANIHLSLLGNNFIENSHINPQKRTFQDFLTSRGIQFSISENDAELNDVSEEILEEIWNNFDFIYASCSGSGAIIQPTRYNTPQRGYGFEISNADSELPIIGIIDTGISAQTPLEPLLIGEDGEFNLTNSGSFTDEANHGTGVAAFAAFGSKLIPGYSGSVETDAKLLPIKILNSREGAISQQRVIELIYYAYLLYGVRIFTLAIGYSNFPLTDNEEISSYAKMLDRLTAELDILIFISTTNNIFEIESSEDYPTRFRGRRANIAPPAESMNNITIGAIADNFSDGRYPILSPSREFPTIYSRKFHYNYDDSNVFNRVTQNKYLQKPDILMPGGDYQEYHYFGSHGFDDGGAAGLEVLSADLEERTFYAIGTSYSAPLAANTAARLCRLYPNLNMQSIKALMINAAGQYNYGALFDGFSENFKRRILGHGTLQTEAALYSDNNRVTMVVEDEIVPGRIKLFPLRIPNYLNEAQRMNGLLKINATLTFKFNPKADNQMLYCPLHVSFAIGKNMVLDDSHTEIITTKDGQQKEIAFPDGYNGNKTANIKLNSSSTGWVQDYYYKNKIVSNVQKVTLSVKKENIINEQNCFKIAVNAAFHKLLTGAQQEPYRKAIPYSLVITLEQKPSKTETLSSLYDELILINDLEAIAEAGLELEL